VAGEDAWNKLAPDLCERMRASSETLFGIELGTYERYCLMTRRWQPSRRA
jgi:hypothetical protein